MTAPAQRLSPCTAQLASAGTKSAGAASEARQIRRLAGQVALLLLALVGLVAVVVRLAAAAPARAWLDYRFTGVPASLAEAASIFAHNASAMLGVFGLLLIAQLSARRSSGAARSQRCLQVVGELLLAGAVAANLVVVGAALGAYGTRMVRAVLPHGPVELAAFALALALYEQGRGRALPIGHVIAVAALALGLLAAAALLEALVTL